MEDVLDDDARHRAIRSRDARFDGVFYFGVTTTGIYCRPSCPAVPARPRNIRFFTTPATAQAAGFRACKRCRPDATPGSPEWNIREDLAGRAMRLIGDGVVDREGVTGLATRLGYSERHVNRQLVAELGASPLALARAQRAQTARILLETTDMTVSTVAFSAGFASIRQFNDTVREIFDQTPTALRTRTRHAGVPTAGTVELRLAFRRPLAVTELFGFLALRAVPGLEEGDAGSYRRALSLPHGTGIVELTAGNVDRGWIDCRLHLADQRDLTAAVQRTRRLLDLDLDPVTVDAQLGADPVLAPLVAARPGLRSPGHVDPEEMAIRAVLGQQVSVVGARTVTARLVQSYGKPLANPLGGLTHTFPTPETLAAVAPDALPMPASRARALLALSAALADGKIRLDAGAERAVVAEQLLALPGLGPWTVNYVRMRALGDPDAFLPTDLGVLRALAHHGLPTAATHIEALSARWRPWRSYAMHHLWAS